MIGRKIDEVRDQIIGLKVIDVESEGRAINLKDGDGRNYSIDFTGEEGAVVYRGTTEEENIGNKLILFDLLLQKLEISEEELWELYE